MNLSNKVFLIIIFMYISFCLKAQYIAPVQNEIITLNLSQLHRTDTTFMYNLEKLLLNKNTKCKSRKTYNIVIEKKDSTKYLVYVELSENPMQNGLGYFEKNGYLYVFKGKIESLFSLTKHKRTFSFVLFNQFIDFPYWDIEYNKINGSMRVITSSE